MENTLPLRTETMEDLNQRFERLLAKIVGVMTSFLKHESEPEAKVKPEAEPEAKVKPKVENKNRRATDPKVRGIESESGNPTAPLV